MTTENVTAATETAVEVQPRPLEDLTPNQLQQWKLTGEIPSEGTETKETPAAEATEHERQAAPEPASDGKEASQEPSIHRLGYRELRNRVRELEAENERLAAQRTSTTEREEPIPAEVTTTAREDQQTAGKERSKPTPNDTDEKGNAKYKTYEDYLEDLADWKTEVKFAAYQKEQTEKAAKEAVDRQQQEITGRWSEQVEAARKKHADFNDVALNPELVIPPGSAVEQWVLDSDIGTEILYYLAQHPEELAEIHRMKPVAAARHLTAIEAELDEGPAPQAPKPEVRTTKAPPPTREVGGRGTAAVDPVTKAVADDDVRAYINSKNREEIARRK